MTVRYRDGIEIELSDGTRVVCDADQPDGDVAVVSHAHGDHLPEGETTAVCSELTAALGTARRDEPLHRTTDDRVDLVPAGHVAGSRAAIITDPDGTRYCYTGDVCTRSRFYLDGFEVPDVDVLITEATYGEPEYVFPDHDELVAEIHGWLTDTDRPVILLGYALGRAQKLQLLAERAGRTVYTTDAVKRVNGPIEDALGVEFPAQSFTDDVELTAEDALVLPMTSGRLDWIQDLAADLDAPVAGFSGWAVDSSFKFRGDYDVTFALSDHCDFAELCGLVEAADPDQIYTQHGSGDTLADYLTSEGYDAQTIKQNQTSLGEF
ncbi:mRNA 3'-end processing factor [Halovenus sp. WSH3]|uniref:mRNA 3'-end processing factor n=1 Tax=Halovenus carboxidivorans TaxID=2692199 RepID=A0A6B0TBG6_9EURY|nr:mRNA 3'-end processing factor [Halovenus carboxidivorans]MXR50539.1 mRNA 3'-end processing factor [Halovenus carboxidivorans]